MKRTLLLVSILAAGLMLCSSVHATPIITLSSASSDSTPASVLGAIFTFSLVDSNSNSVRLTVQNTTASPSVYKLNQIYFNVTAGLALTQEGTIPSNWSFATYQSAGGFGYFDYGLTTTQNQNPILAGGSLSFDFSVAGGSWNLDSFTTDFSWDHPHISKANQTIYIAAAKFVSGPLDDSAFGAAAGAPVPEPATMPVPEPATMLLFGSGLIGLAAFGRKRFSKGA